MVQRTRATWIALERDKWVCQYHLHVLGVLVQATDGHHLFGRMNDTPEAIMALCHTCHMRVHSGEIHNGNLKGLQLERGILSLDMIVEFERQKSVSKEDVREKTDLSELSDGDEDC